MTNCSVYVMIDSAGKYKIGRSKDIKHRRRQLQTGNSDEIKILYSRTFEDCKAAENSIHLIFAAHRKRGEWFSITGANKRLLEKIFTLKDISDSDKESLKRLGLL